MLVKVGKPEVKVKNLPGLPGFEKDKYREEIRKLQEGEFDSEDEAAANIFGPQIPSSRPKESCGDKLLKMDIYGIDP